MIFVRVCEPPYVTDVISEQYQERHLAVSMIRGLTALYLNRLV